MSGGQGLTELAVPQQMERSPHDRRYLRPFAYIDWGQDGQALVRIPIVVHLTHGI